VTPPTIDQYGLGIRVPMLIISAFSKPGFIDHTVYSFSSIMKFIEWDFGLQSLTARDANANNLLNAFDFQQKALSPDIIPLNQSQINQFTPYLWNGGGQIHAPVGSSCNTSNTALAMPSIQSNSSDSDGMVFINNNPD
jgi:phospholipase C